MHNNNFQETDLHDDDLFDESIEHEDYDDCDDCDDCEDYEDCEDCEDLNSDCGDFNEDDEEDEEPYDDGEPWDEDKWNDYADQNMRAGERADMENNS